MRYWLTVHWPPREDEPEKQPDHVWIPDGREEAGLELQKGDLVLIYESKSGRTILRHERDTLRRVKCLRGKQGIIAIARVNGPLLRDRNIPKTKYVDGTELWWCWGARIRILSRDGYVPRIKVNRILGFDRDYTFRGFGEKNSGLKQLTPAEFRALIEVFKVKAKRLVAVETALAKSEQGIRRGVPYDVERSHILRAIKTIDRRGVPARRESTRYDLVHQDKRYPPKYLISLAHTFVDGSEWPASAFSGGEESNNFLISRRFRIADKTGRAVSIQPVVEDDAESFPEGREKYALHRSLERNARISRMAKERRLAETGDLRCDVCHFSFSQRYGGRGQGFIEAHHTIPVSDLRPGHRTRLTYIALVCSNCHRMLHRRRPWLTMDQLRRVLR